MSAYPKSLLSIVASVAGLAVFLVLASLFMVSQPIGPTISRYFYRVNRSENFDFMSLANGTHVNSPDDGGNIAKDLNTAISNSEEMVDQPRGKYIASNEGKADNASLSANETVKVQQLSTEVLTSVYPVQDNISRTHSGHSSSSVHHIFLFHTCMSFHLKVLICCFFFSFEYFYSLGWPLKLFTEFFWCY